MKQGATVEGAHTGRPLTAGRASRAQTLRHAGLAAVAVGGAALAAMLLASAWHSYVGIDGQRSYVLRDDAMISMRYAYNLSRGDGLVWNADEYVQGFTNLGWTLVMAGVFWLGASVPLAPLVVRIINVGLHGTLVALLVGWSWRRGRWLQGLVAGSLVAVDGSLLAFGIGGFEVTAQALLLTLACRFFLDGTRSTLAPVWAALAVVVRPDAMVVFMWVGGFLLLRFRRREGSRQDVVALSVGTLIVAALFVFQRLYYGDWWPNTLYLKGPEGASVSGGLPISTAMP